MHGQELPRWESTTIVFRCKLLTTWSNATEVAQRATPNCSRLQPAPDMGVRDGMPNWLAGAYSI